MDAPSHARKRTTTGSKADPQAPVKITVGNTSLRIYSGAYRQECSGEKRSYSQHTVVFFENDNRKRKTFSNLDAAKRWAKTRAEMIDLGRTKASKMTDAEAESLAFALRDLKPLGIPLNVAINEFIHARKALPVGVSLHAAAVDYATRQKSIVGSKTVPEVVAAFLSVRTQEVEKGRASIRDLRTLRSHLNRFAAFAVMPIHLVQKREIEKWLQTTTVAVKSFNNIRTSLVRLFSFAKSEGSLPEDEITAAEKIRPKKIGDIEIGTLSPGSLQTLLSRADEEARLYLSIAAFTGMRTAELLRLRWEHFDFTSNVIRLPKSVTKTGRKRAVPILPNLREWMKPFIARKGAVFSSEKASDRTIAFAKGQGIEWPDNWARHSYGSYRAVMTKGIGQVAMELGNSETIVKRHYFDAFAGESDATAWFNITPGAGSAKIVQMKGAA